MLRGGAHRARFAGDDAHDGGEALAAQRAAARLLPQHGRALDAEPAVAALEEDGVGRPLHAHDAGAAVLGGILLSVLSARGVVAGSPDKCLQIVMA